MKVGVHENGFALVEALLSESLLSGLESALGMVSSQEKDAKHSFRHLLRKSDAIKTFATASPLNEVITSILGAGAIPVRALLLDKTPAANWYVTWHQDLTIAVKEKVESDGYKAWSMKDGVVHVQPPVAILENMVAARVHLDDCGVANGAIKYIAGTHREGILPQERIDEIRDAAEHTTLPAKRGDVILMRPLILHASSPSETPAHRRVLHIEYANAQLAPGLSWAEA
jgi:ectoine hydroxylase-related dioxygenase (phytanoyl-CoA dioxygenase family)